MQAIPVATPFEGKVLYQAAEGRTEAMKKQQAQELKREAHLSAEAEANKRAITERDQALRSAGQESGIRSLPSGALSQQAVARQASYTSSYCPEG